MSAMNEAEVWKLAGQLAGAKRRRVDATCAVCGTPMEGVTVRRRFCSAACKLRDHRARHQSEERPAEPA